MFGGVLNKTPDSGLPIGSIIMWYGQYNTIPEGWHMCDGTNGTPDLKGKFVLGATGDNGTYGFKAVGGEEKHKLTIDEMPSHIHSSGSLSTSSAGSHSHSVSYCYDVSQSKTSTANALYGWVERGTWYGSTGSAGSHTHTISGSTGSSGHSIPHNNMPPYYALYYIMKIA